MKSVKKCCNLGYLGLILGQDPDNTFEQVGYFETDAEKAKEQNTLSRRLHKNQCTIMIIQLD